MISFASDYINETNPAVLKKLTETNSENTVSYARCS